MVSFEEGNTVLMGSFKFTLRDCVRIKELELKGRVIALYFSEDGTQYKVRYFDNAEAKTVYFFEDELEKPV